jgi:hypothetical protein
MLRLPAPDGRVARTLTRSGEPGRQPLVPVSPPHADGRSPPLVPPLPPSSGTRWWLPHLHGPALRTPVSRPSSHRSQRSARTPLSISPAADLDLAANVELCLSPAIALHHSDAQPMAEASPPAHSLAATHSLGRGRRPRRALASGELPYPRPSATPLLPATAAGLSDSAPAMALPLPTAPLYLTSNCSGYHIPLILAGGRDVPVLHPCADRLALTLVTMAPPRRRGPASLTPPRPKVTHSYFAGGGCGRAPPAARSFALWWQVVARLVRIYRGPTQLEKHASDPRLGWRKLRISLF